MTAPRAPRRAAVRIPPPLAVALAGWLTSAVLFAPAVALPGSTASVALVYALLLLEPGLLLALLLRLPRAGSSWSTIARATALGAGVAIPLAWATRALGLPLEEAARALVALETLAVAWLGVRWWRDEASGAKPMPTGAVPRSRLDRIADLVLAAGALLLAVVYARSIEPSMRSGDLWYYLSYIDWMVHEPARAYVPHSTDPEEMNGRLVQSGFLAFEALIVRCVRAEGNALRVFWSWLPVVVVPSSLVALYGLACALRARAATRIALVVAQIALIFATLVYVQDRDTSGVRWLGSTLFFRAAQDKVFLALVLVPASAALAVEWLRAGGRRFGVALFVAGVGCVMTHPLGLLFLAMATGPYAFMRVLTAPPGERRVRLQRLALLALALAPLVVWPLAQRAEEGVPNTLADRAAFERRAHLVRDSLLITSREQNRFTAHPGLIAHPAIAVGIACALLGGLAWRRDDALYASSLTAAVLAMLYVPGIAPLAGRVVTPYLLWRFTWLLPLALGVAVVLTAVADAARRRAPRRPRAAAAGSLALATAALAVLGEVPRDLSRLPRLLRELPPTPFPPEVAPRLVQPIAERVGPGERILLDPETLGLALALAPHLQTVGWRRGSDPALFDQIAAFYSARFLGPRELALLDQNDVAWVGVRWRLPVADDVERRSDVFEYVDRVESIRLYRVRPAPSTGVHTLAPVERLRAAVQRDPGSSQLHATLALALLDAGRDEQARRELDEALRLDPANADAHFMLGFVCEQRGDRAQAIAHYRRALQLNRNHTGALQALNRIRQGDRNDLNP